MRKIVAVIAALASAPVQAETDDAPCIGMHVKRVNRILASWDFIEGVEPKEWETDTCGGGTGVDGQRIEPWPCFVQKWRARTKDGHRASVWVTYGHARTDDPEWRLSFIRVCPDHGECDKIPLDYCQEPYVPPAKAKAKTKAEVGENEL